jgi:hypothetical protein
MPRNASVVAAEEVAEEEASWICPWCQTFKEEGQDGPYCRACTDYVNDYDKFDDEQFDWGERA